MYNDQYMQNFEHMHINLTNNAIKFYYDDILDLEPFITF